MKGRPRAPAIWLDNKGSGRSRSYCPACAAPGDFERVYNVNPILYVTQVHQKIVPESLADLTRRFDWSDLRIYDINVEGMKHGIVLGTNRWTP